jgi:2'-5' RNA ligase
VTTAVVCAAFDAAGDEQVERLRRLVEREGLRVRRAHRPHLTLAAARVADPAAVVTRAGEIAARHAPFTLTSTGLASFEAGVLFVAITATDALQALQHDAHTTLAGHWPPAFGARSEPDGWLAHCTLATRVPPPALRRLTARPVEGFRLTVDALAVIAVGGQGDIAHLPLGG